MNTESKAFKIIAPVLETLFLAMTGLYLIYRISKSTTFHLVWPAHFESVMMWAMAVIAAMRLVSAGAIRKKSLAALVLAAVYVLVYRNDGYSFLLFMAIFTVGFIDVDYRKILKLYLLAAGLFYGVTLIAGMLGVITNFVTARAGKGIRSAWGMSYYTDFASLGLFLLMTLWVAMKKLPGWAMLLFCGGYLFLSACIAHSNTSTICACLLAFAVLYNAFERSVVDQRKNLRWMKRGPEWFATFGFPLLALIMFLMMLLYARGLNIGYRLNTLLSKRLLYAVRAWRNYGIRPFGTPFQQNGGGFSIFPSNQYNFVDSTYPLVLLRYGWVLFIALCVTWGWTARRAIACADRRLLLVMGIILIHAFSEHHFVDSHFNILVTMPLAAYPSPKAVDEPAASAFTESLRRRETAWIFTALLFAAVAWLVGPTLLSRLKTALEFMHYGHGEHALRLACVLLAVLLGTALAVWAVHSVLTALMLRIGIRQMGRALAVLLLCVLSGAGFWLFSGRIIDAAVEQNGPAIQADRKALEIAVEASQGKVISGVLPAAYAREIDGLTAAAYFEDDLSRLHGATVLMPADTERGPFIDSGFLYVQISDDHALYTGDRAVVEALASAGYHPTGYYSGVQTVNLAEAAELNGLVHDERTGLRLAGGSSGMDNGPWQDLYGGRYTATWQLSLPEGVKPTDDAICVLSVTTDKGERTLLEKKVKLSRFDAQGKLSLSVPFKILDSRNVGFNATVSDGQTLDVEEISIVKTPNYDVHTFYDSRLRRVRQEYYTVDGARQQQKEGWFARDYAYDRYGNVEWMRYYDCNDRLTPVEVGYAQLRRIYNAKRKVVREEYYDAEGKPTVVSGGYAAQEFEYDKAGNAAVVRYFGVDGEPCVIKKGYAELHSVYDEDRRVVYEAYYGADGVPTILSNRYSAVEMTYDGAGNVSSLRYLDAQGAPVTVKKGYTMVRRDYDGQHRLIREAYFDAQDRPVLRTEGYSVIEREYDDAGNVILRRFYGMDGKPVLIKSGYAEVRSEYNGKKQIVREAYYGTTGEPIENSKGYAAVEYTYDKSGKKTGERRYSAKGKLISDDKASKRKG